MARLSPHCQNKEIFTSPPANYSWFPGCTVPTNVRVDLKASQLPIDNLSTQQLSATLRCMWSFQSNCLTRRLYIACRNASFFFFKQAFLTKVSIGEQHRLFIQQKTLLNNEKLQKDFGKQGPGPDTLHNSVSQYVTLVSGWFFLQPH